MKTKLTLLNGKKEESYTLLFSFINTDDEEFLVYTDNKVTDDDILYALIGKKNDDILSCDVSEEDLNLATKLLEKIEKGD